MCAAILALVGTLLLSASSAVAATPLTDYSTNFTRFESPDPQTGGQWSQRMRTVPDLNGDGKNEILVSDYRESFGGFTVAGRVYMQDGATRKIRFSSRFGGESSAWEVDVDASAAEVDGGDQRVG